MSFCYWMLASEQAPVPGTSRLRALIPNLDPQNIRLAWHSHAYFFGRRFFALCSSGNTSKLHIGGQGGSGMLLRAAIRSATVCEIASTSSSSLETRDASVPFSIDLFLITIGTPWGFENRNQ